MRLLLLFSSLIFFSCQGHRILTRDYYLSSELAPSRQLPENIQTYSVSVMANDDYAKAYLTSPYRINQLKIEEKSLVDHGNSDLHILMEVGSFRMHNNQLRKNPSRREHPYYFQIAFTYPVRFIVKDKNGFEFINKVFHERGESQSGYHSAYDLMSGNYSQDIASIKRDVLSEAFKKAKEELKKFSPVEKKITLHLATAISKGKYDFSEYDKQIMPGFKAIKHIATGGVQGDSLLEVPIRVWEEGLEKYSWDKKKHWGVLTASLYNLAVAHRWLGNRDKALDYLDQMQYKLKKGVGIFYNTYREELRAELLEMKQEPDETPVKKEFRKQVITSNLDYSAWNFLLPLNNQFRTAEGFPNYERVDLTDDFIDRLIQNVDEQSVDSVLVLAEVLKQQGKFDDAASAYLKCLQFYNQNVSISKADLLIRTAELEVKLSRVSEALSHLNAAQSMLNRGNTELRAFWLEIYGNYYYLTGNYYEALDHYRQALVIRSRLSDQLATARTHELIGLAHYQSNDFKKADQEFSRSLSMKGNILKGSDLRLADALTLKANAMKQMEGVGGDGEGRPLSHVLADSALAIRTEGLMAAHPSIYFSDFHALEFNPVRFAESDLKVDQAGVLFGEANQYKEDERLTAKLDFYDELIDISADLLGYNHPSLGQYHKLMLETNKQFYLAIEDKWEKVGRGLSGGIERILNKLQSTEDARLDIEIIVENFDENERYLDEIAERYKSSFEYTVESYGDFHPTVADQYIELATFYQAILPSYYAFLERLNGELKDLESKLSYSSSSEADKAIAKKYENLLQDFFYYQQKVLRLEEERLSYFAKGLRADLARYYHWENNVSALLDELEILDFNSLVLSGEVLRKGLFAKSIYTIPYIEEVMPPTDNQEEYEEWVRVEDRSSKGIERCDDLLLFNHHLKQLKRTDDSLATMEDYDRYVDLMVSNLIHEEDRFLLASKTREDRLVALNQLMKGQRKVKGKSELEQAFYYMEKTKAFTLLNSMKEVNAVRQSQIPQSLIDQKVTLESKIRDAKRKVAGKDNKYLDSLSTYKRELLSLEKSLRENYPKYAASSSSVEPYTIRQIKDMLPDNAALISYSYAPDELLRITITKNDPAEYKVLMENSELESQIKSFRNSILYFQDEVYAESGVELGKTLIPKLDNEIDQLIIIPDGDLYTIPFEALLTGKVKTEGEYHTYPYLVKDFKISYLLSASFFKSLQTRTEKGGQFLALAPVFDDADSGPELTARNQRTLSSFVSLDSTGSRGFLKDGRYVQPLPGSASEVRAIVQLLDSAGYETNLLLGSQAKESTLKSQQLSNYQFMHFATHGFVNTQEPSLSGLLLAQSDEKEDGILYSGEVYDLDLNADLVTLSACETGLGRLVTGEGVVGLTRGFLYAGAENILMSYWKVSDRSTSELMINFYKHFLNYRNEGFSPALRRSKTELIQSHSFSHPYYWSPFVLIGY